MPNNPEEEALERLKRSLTPRDKRLPKTPTRRTSIPDVHPTRRPVPNVSDEEGERAVQAVKGQFATPKPTSIPKQLPNPPHVSAEEGEKAIEAIKKGYKKQPRRRRTESVIPKFSEFFYEEDLRGIHRRGGNRPPAANRTGDPKQNRVGGLFNLTDDAALIYWEFFPPQGMERDNPQISELVRLMGVMQSIKGARKIRSMPSILAHFLIGFAHKYYPQFKEFISSQQQDQIGIKLTMVSRESPTVDPEQREMVDRWIDDGIVDNGSIALDMTLRFADHMGLTSKFKQYVEQEIIAAQR